MNLTNRALFVLIACGTVVGLAGTDLVLPAVPGLPAALGGDLESAQLVLAAFAAGTGLGLLIYGELGSRYRPGHLLIVSLLLYGGISLLAATATHLSELIALRLFQGMAAAGPAVFAPVMIKAMYDENAAVAALGRIGSIESMTPALAPILGAWLLSIADWRFSFFLTAAIALMLALIWLAAPQSRQRFEVSTRTGEGYLTLLTNRVFMVHGLSQAFTLGALLIVVFAAPAVITQTLAGELSDFILMQLIGIGFFVLAANTSHYGVERFGPEPTVLFGTVLTALGCISITLLGATAIENKIPLLWGLFVFVNLGLGIRGPAGFFRALQAAGANEARGSALIVLMVMFTAAIGTAMVAPFIDYGLLGVGAFASLVAVSAVVLSLPRFR